MNNYFFKNDHEVISHDTFKTGVVFHGIKHGVIISYFWYVNEPGCLICESNDFRNHDYDIINFHNIINKPSAWFRVSKKSHMLMFSGYVYRYAFDQKVLINPYLFTLPNCYCSWTDLHIGTQHYEYRKEDVDEIVEKFMSGKDIEYQVKKARQFIDNDVPCLLSKMIISVYGEDDFDDE